MSANADLPRGWASARFDEVAAINPSKGAVDADADALVHFVPIAQVREDAGGVDDFYEAPFAQLGGLGKAHELFGDRLGILLEELNQRLAA